MGKLLSLAIVRLSLREANGPLSSFNPVPYAIPLYEDLTGNRRRIATWVIVIDSDSK